jgi:hypothetical protein
MSLRSSNLSAGSEADLAPLRRRVQLRSANGYLRFPTTRTVQLHQSTEALQGRLSIDA